ncbi:MAG: hypothetical protein MUF30_03170 [Burkholderiales bacterium]|jgi:hypothetical protein|nr:hypothetical protein [Burkholderiales bacterium]
MFGSAMLETLLGVVFVFLLVSLLCTSIREALETLLRTRAAFLERGIRELLADPSGDGLAGQIYAHPLVQGLFSGTYTARTRSGSPGALDRGGNLPSYIPGRTFVAALVDIAARTGDPEAQTGRRGVRIDMARLREGIAALDDARVRRALMLLLDEADGDLDRARRAIEAWFDASMERVSGWYKRSSQRLLFGIGLAVAVAMNVDALAIARHLYTHDAQRALVVAQAERVQAAGTVAGTPAAGTLDTLQLPIGWSEATRAQSGADWPIGILATAFAAMLGAPFWFDLLGRIMVVRSTLKPGGAGAPRASTAAPAAVDAAAVPTDPGMPTPAPTAISHAHATAGEVDACDVDLALDPTPDEDLPPARGGVAAVAEGAR